MLLLWTLGASAAMAQQPDLTATKTNDVAGMATVGTPFTWSIRVDNIGSSGFTLNNSLSTLFDRLPNANMSYGTPSVTASSGLTGGSVSCSIHPTVFQLTCTPTTPSTQLAAGGFFTVSFAATATAAGVFTNPRSGGICAADVDDTVPESDETNNLCADTVTASTGATSPDLTAAKSNNVGGNTELALGGWTWSVQVANGGAMDATFTNGQAIFRDNLPSTNIGYGTATIGAQSGISGGTINCSIVGSDLSCAAVGTVTMAAGSGAFTVSFPATPTAAGTFDNPRSGGSCGADPDSLITEDDEGNNICSDSVTVDPSPDLTATKTNDVAGMATVGTPFTWSIRVDNIGSAEARFNNSSTIFDGLPDANMTYGSPSVTGSSGLTGGSLSCTVSSSNLNCLPTSGTTRLAAGGFVTVSFSATATAAGVFTNPRSGRVCAVDVNDSIIEVDDTNNQCSDTVTVGTGSTSPDLTAAKTNNVGGNTEQADGGWIWSVQVANGGAVDATFTNGQAIFRDNLPSTDVSYGAAMIGAQSGISGGTINCSIVGSDLSCVAVGAVNMIAGSGSFTVSIPATPNASGTFDNPRSGGSCGADPDSLIAEDDEGNNVCSDTVTVDPSPDLTATKSNNTASIGAIGVPFTWSITVRNEGGAMASILTGFSVFVDNLPNANMTYGTPSITASSGLTFSPGSATLDCTIVTDILTCISTTGSTQLAPGGFFTVEFSATPTAAQTFDNPRSGGVCAVDPNLFDAEIDETNNTCSDTVTVPPPLPELTVVKTNDVGGTAEVASSWTWNLAVANSGSQAATFTAGQILLTDDLPNVDISYSVPSIGSMSGISGTGAIGCSIVSSTLTCSATGGSVILATGGAFAVGVVANPSASRVFDNPRGGGSCVVDPLGLVTEDNDTNNGCANSVTVVPSPDLTAVKTNNTSGSGGVGVPFAWSIAVGNSGAAATFPAGSEILRDNLPDTNITYGTAAVSASSGVSGAGAITCAITVSDLVCSALGGAVDIAAAGSFTVSFTATATAAGIFVNPRGGGSCAVDPNDAEAESDEGNNGCSDSVDIAGPELTATKSNDAAGSAAVGTPFNWSILVANAGPGHATFADGEVLLRDDLPTDASYGAFAAGSLTNISGSGTVSCTVAAAVLTCVASGGSVTLEGNGSFTASGSVTPTILGSLDNPIASGVCAADPDSAVSESDEGNNTCADSISVAGPELTATKSNDAAGSAAVGTPFNWSILVANAGPGHATFAAGEVLLRDDLPTDASYGAFAAGSLTNISGSGTVSCTVAADVLTCVASGGNVTLEGNGSFTASGPVTPTILGSLDNPIASGVCAADPDSAVSESDEGNNTCADSISVAGPELMATKSNDTTGVGSLGVLFNWTISVANSGAGEAVFADGEVLLRDDLPADAIHGAFAAGNLTNITGGANLSCAQTSNVVTCTAIGGVVTIDAGGSFEVSGSTTPTAVGTLANPDPSGVCAVDPEDVVTELDEADNDCADQVIIRAPELALEKDSDLGSVAIGETITYTLTFVNQGTLDAEGVVLTETVPDLTMFVAAVSDPGWTCFPDASAGSTCELMLGTVAAGEGGSVELAVRVLEGDPGQEIANTATIADDGTNGGDSEPSNNTANKTIGIVVGIPILGEWGRILLVLLLAGAGLGFLRRLG